MKGILFMKKKFLQSLITAMIITIFSMTLFQSSASASAAPIDSESMMDTTYEIETGTEGTEGTEITPQVVGTEGAKMAPQSLPPRQPKKDKFFTTVTLVLAGFFSLQMAEQLTANAINNGIDWTCKEYDKYTAIKYACKIVQD
ncbi:hypothetical protein ACIQXG_22715 [Lysinibacillus sphaericus]|uniref:hypothetical protein n=1 Tax=Lysinibacillus sphaericus TaxID=1421 RepID=UPI003816FF63